MVGHGAWLAVLFFLSSNSFIIIRRFRLHDAFESVFTEEEINEPGHIICCAVGLHVRQTKIQIRLRRCAV